MVFLERVLENQVGKVGRRLAVAIYGSRSVLLFQAATSNHAVTPLMLEVH
jgi:ABC-type enterochelin transport system permease subunit